MLRPPLQSVRAEPSAACALARLYELMGASAQISSASSGTYTRCAASITAQRLENWVSNAPMRPVRVADGITGYATRDAARADVFDFIERFYNPIRRHSTLGYLSPIDFEKAVA